MDKSTIVNQIRLENNLLSMPQVISELLDMTSKDDFSANTLAKIILKDPSMTSKILRMSNSSFYARPVKIKNVDNAISVLGITTVKCLALATSIFQPRQIAARTGLDINAFNNYILSVASGAELIAKEVKYPYPEEALIAGLLQDIGILYFLHHHPDDYKKVLQRNQAGQSLVSAEMEILGIDHCEVGYLLASVWKLPVKIIQSISHHHNITDARQDEVLPNIVKLSILLTYDRFSEPGRNSDDLPKKIEHLLELLRMDREQLNLVTINLLARMVEIGQNIGVNIDDTEGLLVRANQEIWKSYLTIEKLFKEHEKINQRLLEQERIKGASEAQNMALATLSHYLNNTVMVISGHSELLAILQQKGDIEKLVKQVPTSAEIIKSSIDKVVAVMHEVREISPIDEVEHFSKSSAINIDARVEKRLRNMAKEPDAIFPPNKNETNCINQNPK